VAYAVSADLDPEWSTCKSVAAHLHLHRPRRREQSRVLVAGD